MRKINKGQKQKIYKTRGSKEVQKLRSYKHLNLFGKTVFELIKKGYSPSEISKKLNVSKSALSYHIKRLKASGVIEKIGYGVWKAKIFDEKKFKSSRYASPVTFITPYVFEKPKQLKREVRGHSFRFVVTIPIMENWLLRRKYMLKQNIQFKEIPYGESIELRGHRIKIFNRSLDIYFNKDYSWFGSDVQVILKDVLQEFKSLLIAFQNLFHIDLGKQIQWRVSQQHFSLIKNELAKDYLKKDEKLKVFTSDNKLWLLIDNSFNLEELECVHSKTADKDMGEVVQPFFNDLRENKPPKLSDVMRLIHDLAEQNFETASGLNAVVKLMQEKNKNPKHEDLGKPDYFG